MKTDDPFGHLLLAVERGRPDVEIVERDDGVFFTGGGFHYVAPFAKWGAHERQAMRYARGRVLDLGAGPGRVALHLQQRGHEVVGIERSPLVAKVARRRGARDVRVLSIEDLDARLGTFDTVVMYGNNFGMLGTVPKTRRLLKRLLAITSPRARILAGNTDPGPARDAIARAYRRRNRERGKPPGTLRIRLRYGPHVSPFFDWLFLSPRELEQVVDGTGWHVARLVQPGGAPPYVAVLERD